MNDVLLFIALAWAAAFVYATAKFMRITARMTQPPSSCFGADDDTKRDLGMAFLMMVGLAAMPVIWRALS